MSADTPPAFEALPVEVLSNILRQMASPEDLYSTIRASPRALSSFLEFREEILIEVLQTHLPAEIFAELLGLLQVPKHEELSYVPTRSDSIDEYELGTPSTCSRSRDADWFVIVNAFFETHFRNVRAARDLNDAQTYRTPQPAEKHQINYIISMYGTLKRFIRDYQLFVRRNQTDIAPPISTLDASLQRREADLPQGWPPLSENEILRLQRGFLRYELCSRLRATPSQGMGSSQWNSHMDDTLSNYLQRWEEEEIRCVWTYVRKQYEILAGDIVADFRCDVRRLSRKARNAPDNEVTLAPDISDVFTVDFFNCWARNMSCLGLPLLQQVLQSDFDDQRRFLKNTTFFLLAPPYALLLFLQDINPLQSEWLLTHQRFINLPTTNGASPIYTSTTMELAEWPAVTKDDVEQLDKAEEGLKEIGWVFWENSERLKYFGLSGWDRVWDADDHIEWCLDRFRDRPCTWLRRFDVEENFTERILYVTKEDLQEELSAKYAIDPPVPGGEYLFLDRLRAISDWSSKEVSPAFQEICSGMPSTE